MKKKTVSILLALVMCLTLLPMGAIAANVTTVAAPTMEYDNCYSFSDGLAAVKKGEQWGFIGTTGKLVIPFSDYKFDAYNYSSGGWFVEGLCPVYSSTGNGYIDKTGKMVLKADYEMINVFQSGLARVYKDNKYGFIDKTGKLVVPLEYDRASFVDDGLVIVKKSDKYGAIDTTGKLVLPMTYSFISDFSEGLAVIEENNKYGLINAAGKKVADCKYDVIVLPDQGGGCFFDSRALVIKDGKYGYIDVKGKEVIPLIYDNGDLFSGGIARVYKDGKWFCIGVNGNEIVGLSEYAKDYLYYSDGLATVCKDGKYGAIDATGKLVIPYEYDEGLYFSEGYSIVRKDGKYGVLSILDNATPVTPAPATESVTATPSAQSVTVNGKSVAFDVYSINGNNYFKLRDLAFALSGSEKQFEVGWDGAKNAISLISGKTYTAVGGEMTGKGSGSQSGTPTSSAVYKDGAAVTFTAYTIDGNNYFKLRDIGAAFGFGVDYDSATNTVVIDTSKGYTAG